ncbi:hypothetical protein BB561_005819 [Smittium simulii]|uniref:HMG box domain-containing protein n=1 Tax=Smittium simulii TaxID=133385 RepID=A0A2T9Y828_9FUNG|nr:hypothetical protein BB561_005819 [Smittium simulii]
MMENQGGDRMLIHGLNMNPYPVPFYKDDFDRLNAEMHKGHPQLNERYYNDYPHMHSNSPSRNQFSYTLQSPNMINQNMYHPSNIVSPMPNNIIQGNSVYYHPHSNSGSLYNVERPQTHILSSHPYSIPSHVTSITNSPYKRKYKKHPKKDPNAPEKWKSAYQLFREDINKKLEHKKLSFVELSKIHSDQWANLDINQKKYYNDLAMKAKIEYEKKMNQYRKSIQYKEFQEYLNQFYSQEDTVGRVGRPKGKKLNSSSLSGNSSNGSNKAKFPQQIVHQSYSSYTTQNN